MTGAQPVYQRIGHGYAVTRREDPTLASHIARALSDADSVVNIGAGTGSYEPRGRNVIGVEPSALMVAQRPDDAAPVVRAVAEALPFRDQSFDTALGVLTIHHWSDLPQGLSEVRRIANRMVLFLRDPSAAPYWWLYDYFPATHRLVTGREVRLQVLEWVLGSALALTPVAIPFDCQDGFEAAFWRRPETFLDSQACAAMSALALIGKDELHLGQRNLARDLQNGDWVRRYGQLLERTELDLGYRVATMTFS